MLPRDPVILLSYINTKLRDEYSDLDDLCVSLGADKEQVITALAALNYEYDPARNQFV